MFTGAITTTPIPAREGERPGTGRARLMSGAVVAVSSRHGVAIAADSHVVLGKANEQWDVISFAGLEVARADLRGQAGGLGAADD